MMRFIHVFVAVLSLLSVGQSAPVNSCDSLVQPIEIQGRDQLLGKWTLFGEATNFPKSKEITDMVVEHVWMRSTAAADQDDVLVFEQFQKMYGYCVKLSSKARLENNVLSSDVFYNSTARFLSTSCPDCIVAFSDITFGTTTFKGLQLLSTRSKVSPSELEEFKKQVECLELPPPAILSQDKEPCQDDSSVTDLTVELAEMMPKVTAVLERLMNSEGMMEMFMSAMSKFNGFVGN